MREVIQDREVNGRANPRDATQDRDNVIEAQRDIEVRHTMAKMDTEITANHHIAIEAKLHAGENTRVNHQVPTEANLHT